MESLIALGLWLVVLLVAAGAGMRLIRPGRFGIFTWIFYLPLGLGVLATGVLLLGLLGLLLPLWFLVWLAVLGWWGNKPAWEKLRRAPAWLHQQAKQLWEVALPGAGRYPSAGG